MAEKKVVGLQNLKDFYEKGLKEVFVLDPKNEGKAFLWTSSGDSEGYSKSEIDIKLKNLNSGSSESSKSFEDYFSNQIYKFGYDAFDREKYNFYYLDDNGEYSIVTDDLIAEWSEEGTLKDKEFYFNNITSRTLTPVMVANNILSIMDNSIDLILGEKMMIPYNWKPNTITGGFIIIDKNYPDYFTYYKEKENTDTDNNLYYGKYIKIASNTEAQTLGRTKKIYTQRPTVEEIADIIDKKIEASKNSEG